MKDESQKPTKKKDIPKNPDSFPKPSGIPLGAPLSTNQPTASAANVAQNAEATDYTNRILNAAIKKYKDVIEQDVADYREDVGSLQHIVSEFLDDFIVIGHTATSQRVVIRYARSPKDLDGLMQLSKKVLMRMIVEEETSD